MCDHEEICCICLDSVSNMERYFDCRHLIHRKCVDKWIDTQLDDDSYPICPYCKQDCDSKYLINYIVDKKISEENSNNKQEDIWQYYYIKKLINYNYKDNKIFTNIVNFIFGFTLLKYSKYIFNKLAGNSRWL